MKIKEEKVVYDDEKYDYIKIDPIFYIPEKPTKEVVELTIKNFQEVVQNEIKDMVVSRIEYKYQIAVDIEIENLYRLFCLATVEIPKNVMEGVYES